MWHKGEEVAGDWSKLQNEELHDLYSSPNIIWVVRSRRIRWARYVAHTGRKTSVCRDLLGKPEGMKGLGRLRHRWGQY
jgi:hypothetical protein